MIQNGSKRNFLWFRSNNFALRAPWLGWVAGLNLHCGPVSHCQPLSASNVILAPIGLGGSSNQATESN